MKMATIEKKLIKSKSGYRMVTVDERITSPFTIEEPPWIPGFSCSNCHNAECHVKFDFFKRKHHCRRCGGCFCDSCCNSLVDLPRMCFIDPVRHCKSCAVISKKENEFFDKHLRTLMEGGKFQMHADSDTDNDSADISVTRTFNCVLSTDHRYLEFKGEKQKQENIAIRTVTSVEISGTEPDNLGKGIAIQYMNTAGETVWLQMDVDTSSSTRQQSMSWVIALMKGFKLMSESESNRASH